jgi:hypothetical protein
VGNLYFLMVPKGESKQIDAAFCYQDCLLIAECKAFARSFGIDRGDPESLRFRLRKLNQALSEADKKARWLAATPIGTNYDVSRYRAIIPIVVTPFCEYIPSLDSWYWLTPEIPRVLSPPELTESVSNSAAIEATLRSSNCVWSGMP